jgi:hypothetical protein
MSSYRNKLVNNRGNYDDGYNSYNDTPRINPNKKRLLCCNQLNNGSCIFGDRCVYAHNISEQKVDKLRKEVYDIIKSNTMLDYIDFIKNSKLYDTMIHLTKICSNCSLGKCAGGLNCKHGAINQNYQICNNDLQTGECNNNNCGAIHLSIRGLIPYNDQKNTHTKKDIMIKRTCNVPRILLTDDYFKDDIMDIETVIESIGGEGAVKYKLKKNRHKKSIDSESDDTDDSDAIRNYLNSDMPEVDETRSIFFGSRNIE